VTRALWPVAEAAQADYELLRRAVVRGEPLREDRAFRRFAHSGLAGLIAAPVSDPAFLGCVRGARRPPWSGRDDPREAALREVYAFLLADGNAPPRAVSP